MWTPLFLFLFFGTLVALLVVLNTFTRRITDLERKRAELQLEEDRVFDFLHGLGEAFSEGLRPADLHRLIVESATRILNAHGGGLYLADKEGHCMDPAYFSKGCPPLITIPDHVYEQARANAVALDSFVRLTTIRPGEGPLGRIWISGKPRIFSREEALAAGLTEHPTMAASLMAAPLVYRKKILGVLALANTSMSVPFNEEDLKVFQTIIEQSAFALFSESIYLEASEKKRLDHDLEIAREIQSILLPSMPPQFPGYDLSGINIPARQVSGDYYDYIRVDESRLGIAIADVSGKGVPASLIMAMARSVLRSEARGNASAAEVLRRVNQQLYPDIKEDMFISMAYLIINAQNGEATLARAGHDAPLLCRARDRAVEKLSPRGMALGIDSGEVFNRVITDHTFELLAGDCLLFYTDGATEAVDDEGLEFGIHRVVTALQAETPRGARQVVARLTEDLRAFVGNHPRYDDITMIAIRKL